MRFTEAEYNKLISKPKKKRSAYHPYRSKWEAQYAHELELRRKAKDIKSWEYEPVDARVLLTEWQWVGKRKSRASYMPDFRVTHNDGSIEMVEVKGYLWKKDKIKYQWAVSLRPQYTWRMVTYKNGQFIDLHVGIAVNMQDNNKSEI
jgi:hypothetical protein